MTIDATNAFFSDTHSNVNDCGNPDVHNDGRVYYSTKSVRESDIINEILKQAGQQPEAQESALTAEGTETAVGTAIQPQITAKSDETSKLPRAVGQLLPRIKRIVIGGQGGNINIEWN